NTGSTVAGGNNSLTITGNADVDGAITGVTNLSVSGTSNLGANVTTTGTQTYSGAVTLDADVVLSTNNNNITFAEAITGSGKDLTVSTGSGAITLVNVGTSLAPLGDIVLNSSRATNLNGAVYAANLETDSSGTGTEKIVINGGLVKTTGTQTYRESMTLGDDTILDGSIINTRKSINGSDFSLTITGHADIDGVITGVMNFSVSGDSNIGANITTTGTQIYTGPVTLSGGARTLTTTDSQITFSDIVNSEASQARALTIDVGSSKVEFNGVVGGVTGGGLGAITITGNLDLNNAIANAVRLSVSGTSDLAANVTTSGTQTYSGAVTLDADVVLSTNNNNITFAEAITGSGKDLTVSTGIGAITLVNVGTSLAPLGDIVLNSSRATNLDGAVYAANLETDSSGTGTGTIAINGGLVHTTGSQTYREAMTLGDDTTLTGSTVNTRKSINGSDYSLTITGHADIDGAITDLVDLSISGTSNLGADITLTGTQSYSGAVTISNNIELITTSGDINFASTVNGAKTLTLVTGNAGSVTVTGAVGGSAGLTGLNVTTDVLAANAINFANNGILDITITGDSVINGVISGTGISFDKSGVGTLTLNGNNTYGGITSINAGTLKLGHANALGSTASGSGTVVNANSTLDLNGLSITEPVTLNGGRFINGTLAGSMNLTADSILEASSGETEVEGIISGNFGLTITGNGTLTLSGNNTYTGLTNISSGTLRITHANALGSASGSTTIASGATLDLVNVAVASENLVINGGTLKDATSSWGGNITLSGNTTFDITTGDDLTIHGVISGTGSLNKISGGFLIFTNTNTYTGSTTVTAGKLSLAVNNLTNTVGSIAESAKVIANGTFDISGVTTDTTIKSLSGSGSVVLGAKDLNLSAANDTFSGVIGGTGALTLVSGSQTLSGANTYSGITTITDGTLFLSGSGSVSDSAKLVANGTFDISGATSAVNVKSLSGSGLVNLGSQDLTLTAANDDFAGVIGGNGDITLSAGTQTFSGANTYTGQTLVNGGTLVVTHNGGLGATTAGTSIAAGATLDLKNVTIDAESINLAAGTLTTTSGASSLVGSISLSDDATIAVSGTQLTLSGAISGIGFDITKNGSGNLVLSG
ncbi:beta strand repeat-containing protein, partial [Polynucleobacter cosmopolitanus]